MARTAGIRQDKGSAAQTGAGDLAIFGAVPAAFAPAPALADVATASPTANPSASGPSASGDGAGASIHPAEHAALAGTAEAGAPLAPPAAPPAGMMPVAAMPTGPMTAGGVVATSPVVHAGTGIATFVPIPHGSGSLTDQGIVHAPSPPDMAATDGVAAPVAAMPPLAGMPELDAVRGSVVALQDALAALADRLPALDRGPDGIAAHADAVVAAANADAVVAAATGTIATLGEHVGTLGNAVADTAQDTVTAIAGTVSTVTDHVGQVLGGTVDAITDAAGQGAGQGIASVADTVSALGVENILDPVVGIISGAGGAGEPVTAPITAIVDTAIDHFAGADPVGGIQTLVGMVSTADAFDLPLDPIADSLLPATSAALDPLDGLVDATPVDSLLGLGAHHDDGGLLGGDHGLFGHG